MPLKREPAFTSVDEVMLFLTEENPLWGRIEQTPKGRPYYTDRCWDEGIKKTVPKRIFADLLASGLIKIDKEVQRFHTKAIYIAANKGVGNT